MSHYFENDKNLKSEIKELSYKYDSSFFFFFSDNGVFSKDYIDYGSRLLLESYMKNARNDIRVLDVGCGYGYLGIVIGVLTNSYVDMIDVNKRAVHLTEKNIKRYKDFKGKAFISDAYENIKEKYNVIITNPPIRVGKDKVLEILENAFDHMEDDGELYFVIRRDQGALSIKKRLESTQKVEIINKDKGYFVFKSIKL